MFHDSIVAAIRTAVAALVGLILAFLVSKGLNIPDNLGPTLISLLTILFTGGYNYLVVILEKKVSPKFGYLLGVAKTPVYSPTPVDPTPAPADPAAPTDPSTPVYTND